MLYDYASASDYLTLSERRLRQLVSSGEITYVKIGRLVRFRPADLDSFIENRLVPDSLGGVA